MAIGLGLATLAVIAVAHRLGDRPTSSIRVYDISELAASVIAEKIGATPGTRPLLVRLASNTDAEDKAVVDVCLGTAAPKESAYWVVDTSWETEQRRVVIAHSSGELLCPEPSAYKQLPPPLPPPDADLLQQLQHSDRQERLVAAMALAQAHHILESVPALEEALEDGSDAERRRVCEILWKGKSAETLPLLLKATRDVAPRVRGTAAIAIGMIGPDAHTAVPRLTELVSDPDKGVRTNAVSALGRIGPAAASSVPAIIQVTGSTELGPVPGKLHGSTWMAFRDIGPASIPFMEEAFRGKDETTRWKAVWAMRAVSEQDVRAVELLVEALDDDSTLVRANAAQQLANWKLREHAPRLIPPLIAAAKDDEPKVRANSLWALGELGPTAHEAVPVAVAALAHDDHDVRREAATALEKIHARPELAVPALAELLNEPRMRFSALSALRAYGKDAAPTVPKLLPLLMGDDRTNRRMTIDVLADTGDAAQPATDRLFEIVEDPRAGDERCSAAGALARIGADTEQSIFALLKLLTTEPRLCSCAAGGLGLIGHNHSRVIRALRDVVEAGPEVCRPAAATAIARLDDVQYAVRSLTREIDGTTDEYQSSRAQRAIVDIGPAALPTLLELAETVEWPSHVSSSVMEILRKSGQSDVRVDQLIDQLGNSEALNARMLAVELAGQFGQDSSQVDETILRALGDEFYGMRMAGIRAARVTGYCGPFVSSVLAVVREVDPNKKVRAAAGSTADHLPDMQCRVK